MAVMLSGNAVLPDTKKWIIDILPSGCAFACKMKMEVIKWQGFHTDLTSSQLGTKLRTDDFADGGQGKTDLTSAVGLPFLKNSEQEQPLIFYFRMVNARTALQWRIRKISLRYEKRTGK